MTSSFPPTQPAIISTPGVTKLLQKLQNKSSNSNLSVLQLSPPAETASLHLSDTLLHGSSSARISKQQPHVCSSSIHVSQIWGIFTSQKYSHECTTFKGTVQNLPRWNTRPPTHTARLFKVPELDRCMQPCYESLNTRIDSVLFQPVNILAHS